MAKTWLLSLFQLNTETICVKGESVARQNRARQGLLMGRGRPGVNSFRGMYTLSNNTCPTEDHFLTLQLLIAALSTIWGAGIGQW